MPKKPPFFRLFVAKALLAFAALAALSSTLPGQEPPGVEAAPPKAKLNLRELFGGSGSEVGGNHVRFTGSFTIEKGSRNGTVTLAAKIDPDWHVYSITQPSGGPMKSQLKVPTSPNYTVVGLFQADRAPHIRPPGVFPVNSEEHEGAVSWSVPIELSEGVDAQTLIIPINYSGQVCTSGDRGACIPISEQINAKFAGYIEKSSTPGEYHPEAGQAQLVLKGHIEPAAVTRGSTAKLVITAEPNPGWHVYAYAMKDPDTVGANKPTLIYLAPIPGWKRSAVQASVQPRSKERYHEEPVTWTIELAVPPDAPQGDTQLTGYLGFQTCDSKSCLPPQAVQFRVSIPVRSKEQPGQIPLDFLAVGTTEAATVTGYKDVAKLVADDRTQPFEINVKLLIPMIGFGLLGGLILNLMPCVLPVIGLKQIGRAHV